MSSETEYTFVAPNAPRFQFRIPIGGKDEIVRFDNGAVTLKGELAEAVYAELHRPGSALSLHLRCVDRELGERIVKAHMEEFQERAVQGPFNSNMRQEMLLKTLSEREVAMQRPGGTTPEAAKQYAEKFAGDNMALQEIANPRDAALRGDALTDAVPQGAPAVDAQQAADAESALPLEAVPAAPAKAPAKKPAFKAPTKK